MSYILVFLAGYFIGAVGVLIYMTLKRKSMPEWVRKEMGTDWMD